MGRKMVVANETYGFWNEKNTSDPEKFITSNEACYVGEPRKILKTSGKPENVILMPNEIWKCQWRNEEGQLNCLKNLFEEDYFYHGEYKIEDLFKYEAWCSEHWERQQVV